MTPIIHASVELIRAMQGIVPAWCGFEVLWSGYKDHWESRSPNIISARNHSIGRRLSQAESDQVRACNTNMRALPFNGALVWACISTPPKSQRGWALGRIDHNITVTCPNCVQIMFQSIDPVRLDYLLETGKLMELDPVDDSGPGASLRPVK